MKSSILRIIASAALVTALAACMHIQPTPVGDPLGLSNVQSSSLALDNLITFDEAEGLAAQTNHFIGPSEFGHVYFVGAGEVSVDPSSETRDPAFLALLFDHLRQLPEPPHVPDLLVPPGMNDEMLRLLIEQAGRDYMTGQSGTRDVPDRISSDPRQHPAGATRQLLEQQRQQHQQRLEQERDERQREILRKQQELLEQREAAARQLADLRLWEQQRRAQAQSFPFELPMPFYVNAADLNLDLPGLARLLVREFRQEFGLSELTLTRAEGSEFEYPDEIIIRAFSLNIVASQGTSASNVRGLLNYSLARPSGVDYVLAHQGDGRYVPADDSMLAEIRLSTGESRALFDALNDGRHIFGNLDLTLSLSVHVPAGVNIDYSLSGGEAFIHH